MQLMWFVFCLSGGLLLASLSTALECYTCDSAEDPECATKPGQQINVEECVNADDECVTSIVSGITRRGCLARLYPNKYCAEPCDRCNVSLCNRHIFPTDRLRCYQCSGADCINVQGKNSTLLLPCPVYNAKDRCYMNVIALSNVQRGCEYTNLPATCPNTCIKCNFNGCNNELGVFQRSCLQCSHTFASPNPDCLRDQAEAGLGAAKKCAVRQTNRCNNKLMHGDAGKCFTYINPSTGDVQRGCSTTMGLYPAGTVRQCYGIDCNSECVTMSCKNCSTAANDFNCRSGINLRSFQCEAGTYDCYACEKGAQLRRGCADGNFQARPAEACYRCRNADGCNRTPIRTCYHCSSLENAACEQWQDDGESGSVMQAIEQQNCTEPNELCVSTLLNKFNLVYTVRGCAGQIPECSESDPYCVRCNGSLCNRHAISYPRRSTALTVPVVRSSSSGNWEKVHLTTMFKLIGFVLLSSLRIRQLN